MRTPLSFRPLPARRLAATAALMLALPLSVAAQTMPTMSLVIDPVTEGDSGTRPMTFHVVLSAATNVDAQAELFLGPSSAVANEDYLDPGVMQVLIPAGQREVELTVQIVGDTVGEREESFYGVLRDAVGAQLSFINGPVTATIFDNDPLPPQPLVTLDDREVVAENAGTVNILVAMNDLMSPEVRDTGTLTIVDPAVHGTVAPPPSPGNGYVTYTPPVDFSGEDGFSYRFCDDAGVECDEAFVQVVVRPRLDFDISAAVTSAPHGMPFTTLRALPSARFQATPLVEPTTFEFSNSVDPTPASPWDSPAGVSWDMRTLPAPLAGETVTRLFLDAPDGLGREQVMLLGLDDDGDGEPEAGEVRCNSGGMDRCEFAVARTPGQSVSYWVLLHNVFESARSADMNLFAVPMLPADGTLFASGPGHPAAGEDFEVIVGFRDDTMRVDDYRVGYVTVKSDAATVVGEVPVRIRLQPFGPLAQRPVPLVDGLAHEFALEGGQTHDYVFVDVPPGASRLRVTSQSDQNVDLYLIRMDTAVDPEDTTIAAAPAISTAVDSATGASGNEFVEVTGAAATPGRWYVVPRVPGAGPARFTLQAQVDAVAPVVRVGSYFNAARSGSGLFLYPAADQLTGLWYTYNFDRTSTWYYLQAAAPGADGLWTSRIHRSAWDGDSNVLVDVGHLTVTPSGADRFTLTYRIDGLTGSEPMTAFGRGCPLGFDLSSQWFDPARAGTGYSVQLFPNYEFFAAYYYDDRGYSRFVAAELNRFGGVEPTLVVQQLEGACPTCFYQAPVRTDIGTLRRRILSGTFTHIATDLEFAPPLSGGWTTTDQVQLLGGEGTTQGCDP